MDNLYSEGQKQSIDYLRNSLDRLLIEFNDNIPEDLVVTSNLSGIKYKLIKLESINNTTNPIENYQKLANQTAIYPKFSDTDLPIYPALGLAGEAGEVSEKIKKAWRDGFDPINFRNQIWLELGDVLWYVSEIASCLNINLKDVFAENLAKLSKRQKTNKLHGSGDNR